MNRNIGSTPFPNFLLDDVRPNLKGSEWNLLCVIVRQTRGWSDGKGGRKRADWLTHRQLKARTGLATASICRAIDTLVKRKIIEVRNDRGRLLQTSTERKAAKLLWFGLGSMEQGIPLPRTQPPFQKVKTTKEKEYIPAFVDFKNENGEESGVSETEMATTSDLSLEAQEVFRYYQDLFVRSRGGLPLFPVHPRDLGALQSIVDRHGTENTSHLVERFFASRFQHIARQGYSLNAFVHSINLLSRH